MSQSIKMLTLKHLFINEDVHTPTLALMPASCSREDTLKTFYKEIDCTTIDMVRLQIAGKNAYIAVDDNGLFRSYPELETQTGQSIIPGWLVKDDDDRELRLVGNIVFHGIDDEGDTSDCPLSYEEMVELISTKRIRPMMFVSNLTF